MVHEGGAVVELKKKKKSKKEKGEYMRQTSYRSLSALSVKIFLLQRVPQPITERSIRKLSPLQYETMGKA